MKEEKNGEESLSGSRRTRSQVAPDWTVTESLILVNEIAAVESDCSKTLSSYQQWKIIAENCAVLDVSRGLNQCRRKWDSLLAEFTKIKAWESKSTRESYWSLKSERAKKFGLPENFDHELFKAIDDLVKARDERSETDPENDPEEETEVLELNKEMGTQRKRHRSKSQRSAEKLNNCLPGESSKEHSKEMAQKQSVVERPARRQKPEKEDLGDDYLKDLVEEKSNLKCAEERPSKVELEMAVKSLAEETLHDHHVKESIDEKEETLALKLQELAEEIQAIGTETEDNEAANSQNVEEYRIEFTRRQGDKLIASLGDFANTLKQFCNLLQQCK